MAGVFDISTYEQLGGTKTPIDPKVLEAANRARRIALLGEEAVLRMERAGGIFQGGAVPRVQPANGPRFSAAEMNLARTQGAMPSVPGMAPTSPAAATRMGRFRAMLNPKLSGGGAMKFAKGSAIVAPFAGGVKSITDDPRDIDALAESVGLDPTTLAGQLGGRGVNLMRNIGNFATFGAAEPLGRLIAGRSAFDDPYAAPPLPVAPTAAPAAAAGTKVEVPGFGAMPSGWVTDPRERAAANSVIESAAIPPSGTGAIRGESSGRIYRFNNASETPERAAEGAAAREREMFANMPSTGFASIDAAMKATIAQLPALRASGARKGKRADILAQAALAKALEGIDKPSKVDVTPSLDPNKPPTVTVVNADGSVVTHPTAIAPLPPGETAARMLARARNDLKDKVPRKDVAAVLAKYGLTLPDL